jgi:sortase A
VYRYAVATTRIVEPSDVSVLAATADPTLTLVTCYPFDYVGTAPQRFIVRATLTRR